MRAEDIEAEYQRRLEVHPGARWGWSFMYTPESALAHAKVILIGLNPGGHQLDPPYEWDYSAGVNAYIDEAWSGHEVGSHPLQKQVSLLFSALNVKPYEAFAANLVPFRSPSWAELPDKISALYFSRQLWMPLLAQTPAKLVLTLGKLAGEEIGRMINANYHKSHDVQWGDQKIDEYVAQGGRTVLALPHLSRFAIFGGQRVAGTHLVQEVVRRLVI